MLLDRQYTRLDAARAQHALRNPMEDYFFNHPRVRRVVEELTDAEQKGTQP